MKTIDWFYEHLDYIMVTAHRGASYEFPENTLMAMREAVAGGADMIEFDIRNSLDDVPVILHDDTIDRTSDGSGEVYTHTLAELKSYNFSYFLHRQRRFSPAYPKVEIPTFEELLDEFHDKVCMNIQAYARTEKGTQEICRLFKKYNMYKTAYISVNPTMADQIRAIDSKIEFCVLPAWDDRSKPESIMMCKNKYNCRFAQPGAETTNAESLAFMKTNGIRANIFYLDEKDHIQEFRDMGMQGFLSNKAPEMVAALRG